MGLDLISSGLRDRFRFDERNHACSILAGDFPEQWRDILDCLDQFVLHHSWIAAGGGARSAIPVNIDGFLANERGWSPKQYDIAIRVDEAEIPTPTHEIDMVKGRVGVETEWNNKTEFYDRDLNNFRLLHDLSVLSVGIIITRTTELQVLLKRLGIGRKYGASTTHWNKLIPKVNGGGAGGCPLLLVGITEACYDANI